MISLLVLAAGVLAAAAGGELFVRGAVGVAAWWRVPPGIIGATVAAFATSSPELSVGLQASLDETPELALGDALGSNVINITVVVGATLLFGPLAVPWVEIRRDLLAAVAAPVLTLLALIDGRLLRSEAVVLLVVFAVWITLAARDALHRRSDVVAAQGEARHGRALVEMGVGLALLILAGRLIVTAAKDIGESVGLDTFVVGATLVAVGTSTPELATTIIARARGHADVGVGTVLGSNVFNNLWIVGTAALIHPMRTEASEVLLAVVLCLVALAFMVARSGQLQRWRAAPLLTLAVLYIGATLALGAA